MLHLLHGTVVNAAVDELLAVAGMLTEVGMYYALVVVAVYVVAPFAVVEFEK